MSLHPPVRDGKTDFDHTDPEWARAKGFHAPLAQGMMSTAYVSEMMVALLGEGFVQGGRMAVKFIKPVFVGDTLTMHGVVRDKQAAQSGRTRIEVEFWYDDPLQELPDDFRYAVYLADVEGFPYKEIAEIMDTPIGTVMSRLHRGRRMLRDRLTDYARERGMAVSGTGA